MMGWINLKDQRPKAWEIVFLCFRRNGDCHVEKGQYVPGYGLQAFDLMMEPQEYQDLITHWMPIPKLPEC